MTHLLVLSHHDVLAALDPETCAEAMAAVLASHARGETYLPLRSVMMPPAAAGFMGLMPCWRGEHDGKPAAFALKSICLMPGNPARGLDAHQGPGEQHIRAELGEVLAGTAPGRTDPGELTLFRSLGLAIEDLAAAEHAVTVARERGVGTEVEM